MWASFLPRTGHFLCRTVWYDAPKIKVLEVAIEKVKTLFLERHRYAAQVLEQISSTNEVYRLTDEERQIVREGPADLDAGRIVSDADMEAFWQGHRA